MTLRAWIDKLLGRHSKAEEPPPTPADPSEPTTSPQLGPLTEADQELLSGKADEPSEPPPSSDPQSP